MHTEKTPYGYMVTVYGARFRVERDRNGRTIRWHLYSLANKGQITYLRTYDSYSECSIGLRAYADWCRNAHKGAA